MSCIPSLKLSALTAGLALSLPAYAQQGTAPAEPTAQEQSQQQQQPPPPSSQAGTGGSGEQAVQQQPAQQQQATGGSGTQAAQGEAPAADPALMKQARQALADIGAAQQALASKDDAKARQHLTQARQTLDGLYGSGPAANVVKELDRTEGEVQQRGTGVDFAPLKATLRETVTYLDPEVVAGVEQAEQEYKKGDAKASAETLRLARRVLVADVAALPVEAAYARVVAAQALLQENQREDALRLLRGVPVSISEVALTTPMVPVRFNLRAAAKAAEEKNWKRAETLLGTASQQLAQLERTADGKAARAIEPLSDQAEKLRKQVASGQKPKPEQLRKLAERTEQLDVG